jgi:hypothetical protein
MLRRRGGPGLLSTMARTAVISGTATATANRINARSAAKSAAAQPGRQEAPAVAHGDLEHIQTQLTALQAQQAETAALGDAGAMIAQLQQLGKLRESGTLTEDEFAAAKARLLAG